MDLKEEKIKKSLKSLKKIKLILLPISILIIVFGIVDIITYAHAMDKVWLSSGERTYISMMVISGYAMALGGILMLAASMWIIILEKTGIVCSHCGLINQKSAIICHRCKQDMTNAKSVAQYLYNWTTFSDTNSNNQNNNSQNQSVQNNNFTANPNTEVHFCPKCGAAIKDNSSFCSNCGNKI